MAPGIPAVVTGASGFIGRHLVRALLAHGRAVTAVCRRPGDLADLRHPDLDVVVADLETLARGVSCVTPGATVFHLAAIRALVGVPPARFEEINVHAAVAFARAALAAGVGRFVCVSTALIFGPAEPDPVDENRVYEPPLEIGAYVGSRRRGAVAMRRLVEEGLALVTVCPAIVFGPDEATHPNRLAAQARRLVASGIEVLVGGGSAPRTLVYVDDVVRGLLAAEESGVVGEAYILGGEDWSHRDFNRAVLELADRRVRARIDVPSVLARAAARAADALRGYDPRTGYAASLASLGRSWRFRSDKAARAFGYRPLPVREGVRRMLEEGAR